MKFKVTDNEDEVTHRMVLIDSPEKAVLMGWEDPKLDVKAPQFEMISESILDVSKLVEITDSKVLARIYTVVPGLAQAGINVNNAVQAARDGGEVLYRAILPAGERLVESKAMEGAFRGFYRGLDGIKGHANLEAVEAQKGTAVVNNSVSAAMGVASLVVGQYYMSQINSELNEIRDDISKIANFQNNEFRSKVFSLVSHVTRTSNFQIEILENDELRMFTINDLNGLERDCTQLLGQTNLALGDYSKKKILNYDSYEKELNEAHTWFFYQKILLDILFKISDLKYTLHLGAVSREQCNALLPTYTKQVSDTQQRLSKWHKHAIKRLDINVEKTLRVRGVDLGLFIITFDPCKIKQNTADMIKAQVLGHEVDHPQSSYDYFSEDVQLIAKDGKIYYLPQQEPKFEPFYLLVPLAKSE